MKQWLCIAPLALAAVVASAAFAQQPNYGCLANASCGQKGKSTSAVRHDYWQNWICAGCHVGPVTNFVPSPAERALIGVPARFWVMHTEAERNGETAIRASRHRLAPPNRVAPVFRRLMALEPKTR